MENKDNQLERKIEKYHYRFELVRTIVPLLTLVIQIVILYHVLHPK